MRFENDYKIPECRGGIDMLPDQDALALARRLAPVLRFADNEPFLPTRVGVTLLQQPGRSPSAPLHIDFALGATRVIEYAIWWDWDIQHLYELEHIWLHIDADEAVVRVEASAHGGKFPMVDANGDLPVFGGRISLVSAPGKHAFTATVADQVPHSEGVRLACQELAGRGGILVSDMFKEALEGLTAEDHRAVKRHLQSRAFLPASDFNQHLDLAALDFCTWSDLDDWIPGRVRAVVADVREKQPLLKAVLLDSGDTLVNEASEIFDAEGYVVEAGLIPGALEMVQSLAREGYRIVLVADGRVRSFATVLGGHGIAPHFHAQVISETEGCEKPDRRMFQKAMASLGLSDGDAQSTVMVGNHLERDIGGANQVGIISIWQSWSTKRSHIPANSHEVPRYTIRTPGELPALLQEIEQQMGRFSQNPSIASG
jgi:phosphoglycolate phosphatase-like HAD superfamily hydrolase